LRVLTLIESHQCSALPDCATPRIPALLQQEIPETTYLRGLSLIESHQCSALPQCATPWIHALYKNRSLKRPTYVSFPLSNPTSVVRCHSVLRPD
jgi:hypothetical protein